MAGKTKIDGIKNRTIRIGLGIFSHKEIRELAQLRLFWHVVRMGIGNYPKMYTFTMMYQTQQNFIMFIFVLWQRVSILIESSSGPSKIQILTCQYYFRRV